MSEAHQIEAAVAQARDRLPHLPSDYGARAIAAGKTLAQVKGDLVTMMTENPRERGKALMRAQCERQGLFKGRSVSSQAPAGGPVDGASLMAAQLRRQGIEPRRG